MSLAHHLRLMARVSALRKLGMFLALAKATHTKSMVAVAYKHTGAVVAILQC